MGLLCPRTAACTAITASATSFVIVNFHAYLHHTAVDEEQRVVLVRNDARRRHECMPILLGEVVDEGVSNALCRPLAIRSFGGRHGHTTTQGLRSVEFSSRERESEQPRVTCSHFVNQSLSCVKSALRGNLVLHNKKTCDSICAFRTCHRLHLLIPSY